MQVTGWICPGMLVVAFGILFSAFFTSDANFHNDWEQK